MPSTCYLQVIIEISTDHSFLKNDSARALCSGTLWEVLCASQAGTVDQNKSRQPSTIGTCPEDYNSRTSSSIDHITTYFNVTSLSKRYPNDSFAIFWDVKKKANKKASPKSIRWDPLMIQWCLYLRHLSGSAYEMIQESGVIKLPSQRTLRDYTYYTKTTAGFSTDVDQQLIDIAKIKTCPEREKYVVMIMDEMHIREGLVWNKHAPGTSSMITYACMHALINTLIIVQVKYLGTQTLVISHHTFCSPF